MSISIKYKFEIRLNEQKNKKFTKKHISKFFLNPLLIFG